MRPRVIVGSIDAAADVGAAFDLGWGCVYACADVLTDDPPDTEDRESLPTPNLAEVGVKLRTRGATDTAGMDPRILEVVSRDERP